MKRATRKYTEPGQATVISDPEQNGDTVTVACKHPGGLILRLYTMVDFSEPVMGGGFRSVKKAMPQEKTVTIRGSAIPFGGPSNHIVGGYALTEGVPADFWAEWIRQNSDNDMLKKGIIFAQGRHSKVTGQAKEQAGITSGLEPINPLKDARNPKGPNRNLSQIEPGTKE